MKITGIEPIVLRLPEVDAARCDGTQDTLLIRVETDDGISGIGEVDSSPLVCKAVIDAPPSHAIAAGIRSLLLGRNPLEIDLLWDRMYQGTIYFGRNGPAIHALSGVDQALWDIRSKVAGVPLVELLGGAFHPRLRAYASALMPDTPAEAAAMAERFAADGYRAMKFGWGAIGRDPSLDEQLVRAIRAAAGDDVDLMIDAGQVWTVKQALRMAEVYQRHNVFWLEEPLHPDDLAGYRELCSRTTLTIATGEQESNPEAFIRLIDEGNIDVVQPDLGRCGGFSGARRIAAHADAMRKRVVPHAFKSGVLLAASAHFAASIPNGGLVEYTVSTSPIARDLAPDPVSFKDGYVTIPPGRLGLGVELRKDVVDRYRVA